MSGQVTRFLGGSPLGVVVRLAIISLLVGILLSWLDLRPLDLLDGVADLFRYVWVTLFGSLGRAWDYFLLGAVIVVPIFLLSRLFKTGRG